MAARPVPAATRDKLAKLMPRLATQFEGERIATVAAIERVLRADGLDWNDLTAAFAGGETARPPPRAQHPPRDDGPGPRLFAASELLTVINQIQRTVDLNDRSAGFLLSISSLARRRDPVRLSPKQFAWLRDLAQDAGIV